MNLTVWLCAASARWFDPAAAVGPPQATSQSLGVLALKGYSPRHLPLAIIKENMLMVSTLH